MGRSFILSILIRSGPYSLQEQLEEEKWSQGAKSSKAKEDKEEKRKAELARKEEKARLLAEEEASLPPKPKPTSKTGGKKASKAPPKAPAGPGALAAGGIKGNIVFRLVIKGSKAQGKKN